MEELRVVVERLRRAGAKVVILFGSRARGDWLPWSDYDLLIIGEFDKPHLERIGDILELLSDVKLPVEPHPYTLREVLEMLRRGNPLIIDALEEGRVLHAEREYLEPLERLYRELKRRGLRRTRVSLILPEPPRSSRPRREEIENFG